MTGLLEETSPGHFTLKGELTFATVVGVWKDSQPRLARATGKVVIDLRQVSRADSAALGLLVEWLRLGARKGVSLSFRHLPPDLATMASAYHLEPLLPVDG